MTLDTELDQLRAILARRIRERLEADGPIAPAFLDVARRFLLDNTPKPGRLPPAARPLVEDLPFPDEVE